MEQASDGEEVRPKRAKHDVNVDSVSPKKVANSVSSLELLNSPTTSKYERSQAVPVAESTGALRLEKKSRQVLKKLGSSECLHASKELSIYSTSEDLLNTPIKTGETGSLDFSELSALGSEKKTSTKSSNCDITRARKVPDFNEKVNPENEEALVSKEYEEELERQMECLATKNRLSATNVKNIIRAVLTSDDFTKMMQFHLEGKREKPNFELKLTRAKARQLMAHESVVTWLPTGSGKCSQKSDIEILVSDELLEDSSDEEYDPVEDAAHSDDELKTDPLADDDIAVEDVADMSCCSAQLPDEDEKDRENIGQRTRSKFSLSETPLEAIAQAFVPPDITTDMYATECDNQDWLNFLKEFDSNVCENNDDENDPEYNVMMDEDHEDVDVEELRADNAVKVSKKELNSLMAELFEYTEMLSSDDEESHKENECTGNEKEKGKPTPEKKQNKSPQPLVASVIRPSNLTELEVLLITEHFVKHVQFLVQSYLIGLGNPFAEDESINKVYSMLEQLYLMSSTLNKSGILIDNLTGAWHLAGKWKNFCTERNDTLENLKVWYRGKSEEARRKNRKTKLYARPPIHPDILSFAITSPAFAFPELLPVAAFGPALSRHRDLLSNSELQLLAIGLDIVCSNEKFDPEKHDHLIKALNKIHKELMPFHSPESLLKLVQRLKAHGKNSPIQYFFTYGHAPPVTHILKWSINAKVKRLYQIRSNIMPVPWNSKVIDYKTGSRSNK